MAISSPLSSLTAAAKTTTKRTIGLARLLSRNIETKKNISTSIGLFKRRRRDISKRDALRDRLLAPVLVTRQGGARSLALADKSTSISDRLLGFIGYLSAGWILSNMPTWISLGTQFTSRLITAGSILSNYGDETVRVMNEIKNVFGAALENISRFDFTDSSYRVRSSLNDLKNEIDTLGVGLKQAFDVMLQPFKDVPPPGTIQPDEPDKKPPSTPPPSGGNADFWTLVAVVSREDSDPQGQADVAQSIYNRAASGAYGSKNIRELILRGGQYAPTWEFPKAKSQQTPNKEWYQITDAQSAAKATGFKVGTIQNVAKNITNPSLQKEASKFVGGRTDFRGYQVSGGIQRKSGDNYFGWYESYKGGQIATVPDLVGTPPVARQKPTQPPITGQGRLQLRGSLAKSIGKDVDFIEVTSLIGDGRNHGGIDIATPAGTYIALRVDCEVVASGTYGNYGLLIDVWIPSKGIQLRMAHLSSVLIKSGKIPAGTSFARVGQSGRATGPHIHLEYDTKKGTRGGGAINDDPNYGANLEQYVKLLLLTRNKNKGKFSPVTTTASLVPGAPSITTDTEDQVEMETNAYLEGLLNGITQERQGRKILIIDDRSMGGVQQVISSGGSGDLQIQIPDSVLLNNFIKNKLLLDLNYL